MTWSRLTRRTEIPKLTWLMEALKRAGIACRLNGDSFQAPVLEVETSEVDRAQRILDPIDGLADTDSMFSNLDSARAWWLKPPRREEVAALVAGVGLVANQIRRTIADGVKCVPEGASEFDCPYATGVIEACPSNLWSACRPMARLENYLLALAETMKADQDKALTRCSELISELKIAATGRDPTNHMIAFCHVLSLRMTEGRLGRLVKLAKKSSREVVADVLNETVQQGAAVVLKRMEIVSEIEPRQEAS